MNGHGQEQRRDQEQRVDDMLASRGEFGLICAGKYAEPQKKRLPLSNRGDVEMAQFQVVVDHAALRFPASSLKCVSGSSAIGEHLQSVKVHSVA